VGGLFDCGTGPTLDSWKRRSQRLGYYYALLDCKFQVDVFGEPKTRENYYTAEGFVCDAFLGYTFKTLFPKGSAKNAHCMNVRQTSNVEAAPILRRVVLLLEHLIHVRLVQLRVDL